MYMPFFDFFAAEFAEALWVRESSSDDWAYSAMPAPATSSVHAAAMRSDESIPRVLVRGFNFIRYETEDFVEVILRGPSRGARRAEAARVAIGETGVKAKVTNCYFFC